MDQNNSAVGVYINHEHAVIALKKLIKSGFDNKKISVLGKADIEDDHVNAFYADDTVNRPVQIGAVAGPILGVLSGLGISLIPGFGMVYGAGAIVGAIAGFDLGVIGGGLVSLLLTYGMPKNAIRDYKQQMEDGKHLIIVHGTEKEVTAAEKLMNDETTAIKVAKHL